jgi:hypothetical protein
MARHHLVIRAEANARSLISKGQDSGHRLEGPTIIGGDEYVTV